MTVLNIGLVGSGKMALAHGHALANANFCSPYQIISFSSQPAMMADRLTANGAGGSDFSVASCVADLCARSDVIISATDVMKTESLIYELVGSRKPCLIEKPGFSSVASFEMFCSKYANVENLFFAFNRRFYRGVLFLRDYLSVNREKLLGIDFFCGDRFQPDYLERHFGHFGLEAKLLNTTIHSIDLINFLLESPVIDDCAVSEQRVLVRYRLDNLFFNFHAVFQAPQHTSLKMYFANGDCVHLEPLEQMKFFSGTSGVEKTEHGYIFKPAEVLKENERSKPGLENMINCFVNLEKMPEGQIGRLPSLRATKKNFDDIKFILDAL